jgi:hypothetical protein
MLPLLMALGAIGQPALAESTASLGQTAWVFSTVEQSEWCPAGNVRLDLRTGQFAFTARASRQLCQQVGLERPIRIGTLDTQGLTPIRAAYLRVVSEGLVNPDCRDGRRPEELIVSNGGMRVLVVTTGAATASPPDELGCWSEAARALQDALDDTFSALQQP